MQQVYFLIPGLILSPQEKELIGAPVLEAAGSLSTGLVQDAVRQDFSSRPFSRSVHLIWAWSVLCRRALPAVTAPFVWSVNQGPQLANEVWSLDLAHADENGRLYPVENLTDEAIEAFASAMTVPLQSRGFRLQRWDKTLYLTRKTPWGVDVRPFEAMVGRKPSLQDDFEASLEQTDPAGAWHDLEELNETLKDASIESAGQALNALWISGGGCYSNFYPPTRIRSVLTDIDAVTGWALAAGILNHRLGRITGAEEWPADAPNGECIAVIDTLYSAWLAKDWAKWQQLLPSVIFQVDALAQAARKKGCDRTVIVGCGESLTVTLARKNNNPKSLLARLSPTRKLPAQHWLFQDGGRQ